MKKNILKQLIREEIRKVLNESQDGYLNSLLDKILDQGIESLSDEEKQALDQFSSGSKPKSPEEVMQDLFIEWKKGEIEAGNDELDTIFNWEDISKFDEGLQKSFIDYTVLVKKYPNIDKEDLAIVSSIGNGILLGDEGSKASLEYKWNKERFVNIDEETYYNILKKYFKIDVDDMLDGWYEEESADTTLIEKNPPPARQIKMLDKIGFEKDSNSGVNKYSTWDYRVPNGRYFVQPYFYSYTYQNWESGSVVTSTFKTLKDLLIDLKERKANSSN